MAQSSGKQIEGIIPLDDVGNILGRKIPGGLPGHGRPLQPDFNIGDLKENRWYTDFHARFQSKEILSIEEMVKQIMFFAELDFYLNTIATSFLPRIVSVGTTPTQITQRARYPKAYIFLNPGEISGQTSQFTFYPSATRVALFNTPSTAFTVSGVETIAMWLDLTARTGIPTLTVDVETQDPLSGNFAVAQADIFSGLAVPVNTHYANVGSLGVDRIIRLVATVAVGATDLTFSISGLAKGNALTPIGSTIFIGDKNVNTTMGIRVLPTQERKFYLLPNVELFAVVPFDTQNFMVWELQ